MKVCYIKKSDPNYERMIIQQDLSRPKGFMVWAGISSHDKTTLRYVKPGAKINSDYYINNILKPFLSRDIPRLFPSNEKNENDFSSGQCSQSCFEKNNRLFEFIKD
ncbi:unnamed protein product [Rotaria magnacalcarata]|uniref:Uncharacterized protein n=1 Tax=Rotaria magnacalcarata TaxID=392030 RepID=A0A820NKB8_9BILA|nr:unnamed protein product [Rotaria magnacalcarata]CAF4389756.1 unnamed protein product [Rotaria magnacalcarata]